MLNSLVGFFGLCCECMLLLLCLLKMDLVIILGGVNIWRCSFFWGEVGLFLKNKFLRSFLLGGLMVKCDLDLWGGRVGRVG